MADDDGQLARTVGKRIREARDSRGFTQAQLAHYIGMTRSSVANLEAGRQNMSVISLTRLLAALGLDLSAVVRPEDLPDLPPLPPPPHRVEIRSLLEVACITCGNRVLDVTKSRETAREIRDGHIAERLENA